MPVPVPMQMPILVKKNHRAIQDVFENIILWIMQPPFDLSVVLLLVKSLKSRLFNYDSSTGAGADAGDSTDADASSNNFAMPVSMQEPISDLKKKNSSAKISKLRTPAPYWHFLTPFPPEVPVVAF